MNERTSKPVNAPKITRPGESAEHLGSRNVTEFLPAIFKTTANKQFFDATLEQLMSTGSLMTINNMVGSNFDQPQANYLTDNRSSDSTQFVPGIINRDDEGTVTQALAYDDLINSLQFNDVDVNQHNKLLNEQGYTLDLPINYDMFINYHKYFWLVDILPPCSIKPTQADAIDIDTIFNDNVYTTPTLSTSNTLELMNGMRVRFMPTQIDRFTQTVPGNQIFTATVNQANTIKVYKNNELVENIPANYTYNSAGGVVIFATAPAVNDEIEIHTFYAYSTSGDYAVGDIYIVDGVGSNNGIQFTKQFTSGVVESTYSTREWLNHTIYSSQEPKGFDEDGTSFEFDPYDIREWRMTTRDYVVEKRYSSDRSAWSRSNLWIHQTAAEAVVTFENLDYNEYLADNFRGVRPIIEFKDGIEKYNYGTNHIGYVAHLIEDTIDPAAQIVGEINYSHNTYGITTDWQFQSGYEDGDRVRVNMSGYVTYWECIQTHGDPFNPTYYENRKYWRQITDENLEDGNLVLFLRTTNTAYTNRIFRVGGVTAGTGITLTEVYGPSSTPLNSGDKVVVIKGYNTLAWDDDESTKPYSGSEWYWNGTAWVYGQQKMHRSAGMKTQLYDTTLTKLDDATKYPSNTFSGDYIFNYGYNSASKFDDALGFSPRYVDYGNTPGLDFDFGAGGQRYEYTLFDTDSSNTKTLEIPGYYYYKINGEYHNSWSLVRNGQPVRRHIQKTVQDINSQLTFNLGTNSYSKSTKYEFSLSYDKLRVSNHTSTRIDPISGSLPDLYMAYNTNYDIQTLFPQADIEFVKFNGDPLTGITRTAGSNDSFQLQIAAPTYNLFKYRLVSDPTNYGVIRLYTETNPNNIQVLKNGEQFTNYNLTGNLLTITSGLLLDDVFDVTFHSDSNLDETAEGNFMPADTQLYNPQNKRLTQASFGDLVSHIKDQMENIPEFTGSYFGTNNYDSISHIHQFGGTIRQQPFSTELLNLLETNNDTDVFNAIKYSANSYEKFKKQFIRKVQQLNYSIDQDTPVHQLVDRALEEINVGKNSNSAFANSNMAMYTGYESADYSWTNTMTASFALPRTRNTYDDAYNHIQVWLNEDNGAGTMIWRPLQLNTEYIITDAQLTVTTPVTHGSSGLAYIHVRWYPQNATSFIPGSAVKLGLIKPYTPQLTTSGSDNIIIQHDGSIHTRSGTELYDRNSAGFSIVDSAIWDLEHRIYNNLHSDIDNIVDYLDIMPNPYRPTQYTWGDLTTALLNEFNRWSSENNITQLQSSTYYDAGDRFTWNYSSVGPQIGGWKGLYTYYFNTHRPHTHPWEMLGYHKKPSWWDANYSWTVPAERTALIAALTYGHYNNPSEAYKKYNKNLAVSKELYDLSSNTLVTTGGVLNDPVTAGVVPIPVDPGKDFVFGDWGPVEDTWRQTSEYQTKLFLGLMRQRPLWITNSYFSSNKRKQLDLNNLHTAHWTNDTVKELTDNVNPQLSNIFYSDSIIESVRVVDGGSGFTSAPSLAVYSNFGSGAELTAYVSNGVITNVSVNNPGVDYYNKPTITTSTGSATLEAVLVNDAKKYFVGLSNAILEFAHFNGTTSNTVLDRFNYSEYGPIIKAGGFLNPANQKFILESSQDKGATRIPEENYTSLLYTSKPNKEVFFGGIKISIDTNGYKIQGFDNSNQYFTYNAPVTSGQKVVVSGAADLFRYSRYEENTSQLNYNTVLKGMQQVYDFIHGYDYYLKSQGWDSNWRGVANDFVTWATGTSTSVPLTIIPNPKSIKILDGDRGYYDTLNKRYEGVYNILDQNGKQITTNKVLVNRELMNKDSYTEISVKDQNDSIYGIRLYQVEVEHAIVFDTTTRFDDVVYKPEIGQLHKRIIWKGSRTKDWNGKFYSPGYIIDGNSVYQNLDTTARELDQYYGAGNALGNSQMVDAARFNAGYNKPKWSEKLNLDDDTLFEFMKGTKKYRGTRFAVDAFVRNNALFDAQADVNIYEEWAIRTADYGDTRSRDTIEFEINKNLLTTSPQPVRFTDEEITDVLTDITIDIDPNSPLLVTGTPGDVFTTRNPKTYLTQTNATISQEQEFANDFITAGLPLTSETDYRVLTKEDMTLFPEPAKSDYSFDGEWQYMSQWNNRQSYKFNDKVLYEGRAWEMLDPDGSSGLFRPNDPIIVTGTTSLPVVPSTGETLIIDGTVVDLVRSSSTTTLDVINVVGTQDIGSSDVVTHNSTLVLGEASNVAQTIVFENEVATLEYQDITKTGTVTNPTIQGSATATLIIDGVTVNFNDTQSTTNNITSQTAYENAFNTSWITNNSNSQISAGATNRINAIEALRVGYTSAQGSAQWQGFLNNYYSQSDAGLYIDLLIIEYGNGGLSYSSQMAALVQSDVEIINNILNTSYVANDVLTGVTTIPAGDITAARTALLQGSYIVAIKNWLINNINTVFNTNTIITTDSGSEFQLYQLADIIQEINSAGIPNVSASAFNNQLRITKTTNDRSLSFSLTISVGTENSNVGFLTTTQTINSTGNTIITTPNLSLAQVVSQINNAGVNGITAQINQANTNLLQINCNKATLFIGTGSANSVVGLTTGVIPAGTTTSQVSVALYISDIVQSINNAGISGVSASISNNRVQLTSNNSTLVIGTGTANSTLGFTAQTYSATQTTISNVFNAIVGSDGNQVFIQMDNDPNIFSIWVADNSEQGSFNQGYAVYQTMDFGMYVSRACAGVNPGDDAEITVTRQTGDVQSHNLVEGDYVLIRGSTTVPNIDGIHRVTSVDSANTQKFYIDEYIEQEGGTGNIYPLRNVRFSSKSQLDNNINAQQNGVYKYNFSGLRQNNQQSPIYIFVDNDGTGKPAVYKYTGTWTDGGGHSVSELKAVRTQGRQARNDLIENVKIYDAKRKSTIAQLETWDPAKGIVLGFIRSEIDYLITADIANYNYNTIEGEQADSNAWGAAQVGKRWWNLNTAVYLNYEQGSIEYQQNNWGRLFDGASIDIYEWTRSPVLPEQWSTLVDQGTKIRGVTASGEAYKETIDGDDVYFWSENTYYNRRTKRNETEYYFWVKNKSSYEGQRNYNTLQLSTILQNPEGFDLSWAAASGSNILFLTNVDKYVTRDSVAQVNQIYTSNSEPMNEWTMLAENDPSVAIPEYLHIKMRDSLAGFNNYQQRYTYTTWSNTTVYQPNQVVQEGSDFYISLANGTQNGPNQNQQPSLDTDMSHWVKIYDYDLPPETQQDDIDVWRGQPVPDLDLHPYNRYGHLVRPRQSLYRNLVDARQNWVNKVNELLSTIIVIDEIQNWESTFNYTFVLGTVTYDTKPYWNWVNWSASGYDSSIVADKTVATQQDLIDLIDEPDGTYVKVRTVIHADGINRPEIHYYNNGTSTMVWKEKATIQITEETWNQSKFGHGWDASGFDIMPFDSGSSDVIGKLFDNLRTKVFVGTHLAKYNELWFNCLHEAVVQNTTDDFAFKTSYVKLEVEHPLLLTQQHFKRYDASVVEDFFHDIKPFHTKLHSGLEKVTHGEATQIEIDEEDRRSIITMLYNDHTTRDWEGDTLLLGGDFTNEPDHTDGMEFTTVDNDIEYIYNGNEFDQPHEEGWGEELYPVDYSENVSILVQTNTAGNTVDAETRSFRMNLYHPNNLQTSTVIEDTRKTEITASIGATDTTIGVLSTAALADYGVVWIGSERVEYGAKDTTNLLYCKRGTNSTSAQEHISGTTVIEANEEIPILARFSDYGDDLRMAYNDSGVSLADPGSPGISPEHAFIRNAGQGSI